MKTSFAPVIAVAILSSTALGACAAARLEPADPQQKVANKPHAAITELGKGLSLQVEAGSWMADERVKDHVTAMKVTVINRSAKAVQLSYGAFTLESNDGKIYRALAPKDVPIRGATRSIGLPADAIVTRSSDSTVNAPDRELSEKDSIRNRLEEQAIKSGDIPAGERVVGYVFFERVPATVTTITFHGTVQDAKTGAKSKDGVLIFRPREFR